MTGITLLLAAAALTGGVKERAAEPDLRGAWALETYVLKDGSRRPLSGRIVFTDKEWIVLFFVLDEGKPQRGNGEGGTYRLDGARLVFTHLYHLSAAEASAGPGSPVKMEIRDPATASTEPCTITLQGDRLRIDFLPSGNAILLTRTSRF